MPGKTNQLSRLCQELKRRKVIHVVLVYASSSFVIIELINNIYGPLNLPEWTPLTTIVILAVGFPFAIVIFWIFDINLKGIEKTKPLDFSSTHENKILSEQPSRFKNSIAVLPFLDMSPEKDQEYFCDGIAEEIINVLAHIESLKVIARTSSFAFKNKNEDIREVGAKLGVDTMLEGSIRKSEKRIRITAQLIRVSDGSHIWSEKYDRDIQDIFAIQDEISLAIVSNLKIKLLGKEKEAMIKRGTNNLEAYNLYLKGNYHWQMITSEELKKAISFYELALKSDPNFALAHCGIAVAHWGLSYWGNMPPDQAYPLIEKYLQSAIELDNDLSEIYYLRAVINIFYKWNMDLAETEFKKAIKLNPNSVSSHSSYSIFLTCVEKHEEAISEAKKATELDPLSSYYNAMVANAYNFAGQYDEAIQHCNITMDKFPDHFFIHYFLGFAHHGKKMFKKAVPEYEKALKLSGRAQLVIANLIIAYIEIGDNEKADKLLTELIELSNKIYVLPSHFYKIYQIKGEKDKAFEWMERAFKEHDSFLPLIRIHPYKELRIPDEPRYKELLKKSGFG